MECYEGATMIKTFRGLMADDTQDTIVLHTNDGSTGYKIVKFEIMGGAPGAANYEAVMKVYKIPQVGGGLPGVTATVDFSDNTLLAAATYQANAAAFNYPTTQFVIFDNEIFNQDIYVTCDDLQSNTLNYYLELEQVKLDLGESTVATLKDIRNLEYPPPGG
jgi:hypothetical protein